MCFLNGELKHEAPQTAWFSIHFAYPCDGYKLNIPSIYKCIQPPRHRDSINNSFKV